MKIKSWKTPNWGIGIEWSIRDKCVGLTIIHWYINIDWGL